MRNAELTISLPTLMENARVLRKRVPEKTRMLCVVKADAYGHGAIPFALALERENITDRFAVALSEEGLALREAGVRGHILVLGGGGEASLREGARAGLAQAVYTSEALRVLAEEARALGRPLQAHLKLDTGMTRVGVRTEEELRALLDLWKTLPEVEMEGCFTHFCAADMDEAFTCLQDRRFSEGLAIVRAYGFAPIAHAAASTAMLKPAYQHDMVRAGIALYGSCMPELEGALRGAQRLTAKPTRLERVPAGETISYGRTHTLARDSLIATVPVGYGDGYPRILGNRAQVLVHGKRAPIVGRVCMDMLMVDVTDIENVTVDDEIVLLGSQGDDCITPDELAVLADTIPYEIMLGFLPRLKRRIAEE